MEDILISVLIVFNAAIFKCLIKYFSTLLIIVFSKEL